MYHNKLLHPGIKIQLEQESGRGWNAIISEDWVKKLDA